MMGPPDSMGLTPRVCKEIFRLARRDKTKLKFTVKFYMCELYKDALIDLLGPEADDPEANSDKLVIKKDTRGVVRVQGATERLCTGADDLMGCIEDGSKRRQVASTLLNSDSSRSQLLTCQAFANPQSGDDYKEKKEAERCVFEGKKQVEVSNR